MKKKSELSETDIFFIKAVYAEMVMQENPPIANVFEFFEYMSKEKAAILDMILKADNEERQTLWKQLDDINFQLNEVENYIKLLTSNDN